MPKVRCPHCGKETEYSKDNPYRPFCCERCQLLDLGNWAEGRYAIPDPDSTPPTHAEDNSQDENDGSSYGRILH